jgi:glycosyltransferase involved in cell wall biosynthesis
MKILTISETLVAGGAEWFSLRLSDALRQQGNQVYFYIIRPDLINAKLLHKFPEIKIYHLPVLLIKLLVIMDRVIQKLTGSTDVMVTWMNSIAIRIFLKKKQIEVIHGHLMKSDFTAMIAKKGLPIRQVTTIHGDYIQYIKHDKKNMLKKASKILTLLDAIAIISDEQKHILGNFMPSTQSKMHKIYNGYALPDKTFPETERNFFTFGMIARGIPEKGWEPAIQAFLKIKDEHIRLMLYGESAYLDALRKKYTDQRIVFAGFCDSPLDAVHNFDVGLLPSYYPSESLPTTIIEYLALNKPVIATDVGEIKKMITLESGDKAGIIIDEIDPQQMIDPLHKAMLTFLQHKHLYHEMKKNCVKAFKKFAMPTCIANYQKIYNP